jgi:hypothetical protein
MSVLGLLFGAALLMQGPASSQIGDLRVDATNTQAILSYTAPDNLPCKLQVSESDSFQPIVNDLNTALFPGADSDDREGNGQDGQRRFFVIGKRRADRASDERFYSRALQVATQHFYLLRCGADTSVGEFTTKNLPSGDSHPELPPFDPKGFGNYGWPSLDWSNRNAYYIDPLTGVVVKLVTAPGDWGNRSAATFHPDMYDTPSAGWTNAANIVSGSASKLATTSAARAPIFVALESSNLPGRSGGYEPKFATDDIGIHIYGSGTAPAPIDRAIQVCLSVDSGRSCYTSSIEVMLPQGQAVDAGVFPRSFPQPMYRGWGKPAPREFLPMNGKANVSGGVFTQTRNGYGAPPNSSSMFAAQLPKESKIWIQGSAPACPHNVCTVLSTESGTELTLAEGGVSLENANFGGMNFGARITKVTGTGSVSVSASYEVAWSYLVTLPVTGATDQCGRKTVTTTVDAAGNPLGGGRSIEGYLCMIPLVVGSSALYFFSTETGEARFLSAFRPPDSLPGHQAGDFPANPVYPGPMTANFDPDKPNVLFINSNTKSGKRSAFRITYTGDYRALRYNYPLGGGGEQPATPNDKLVWENINKPSEGKDIQTQVDKRFPDYDKNKFGDLSDVQGSGVSGRYMAFVKNIGFQNSPCWIFLLNVQTGDVEIGFNTYDGKFDRELLRWAGCHYADAASIPDALLMATSIMRGGDPNNSYYGPYSAKVTSVKKQGTFVAETSLPWPIDNSYDTGCPEDIPDKFKELGATGNKCVTLRIDGELCSSFATPKEKQVFPCPGDPNRSMLQKLEPGDMVTDPAQPRPGVDGERLRVLKKTYDGQEIELTLLRNSAASYCTVPLTYQGQHANGWEIIATPGGGTCEGAIVYVNGLTNEVVQENGTLLSGHFDLGTGKDDGAYTVVGIGYNVRFNHPPSDIGKGQDYQVLMDPNFEGRYPYASYNILQSYGSIRQWTAPPEERTWAIDFRHFNGGYGAGAEALGFYVGGDITVERVSIGGEPSSQVYKVSVIGKVDYKRFPLLSIAGRYLLQEKSSPEQGDTLTDEDEWRFCYAYTDGECNQNSSAGDIYANVPLAALTGHCYTSQNTLNTPCALSAHPVGGWVTQTDISRRDPVGVRFRRLTMGFSGPGRQYSFANARATPDGKWAFLPGFWLDGLRQEIIAIKLPPFEIDESHNFTGFVSLPLQAEDVPDATQAWVEFGYAENGPPDQLFCTGRQETCVATVSTADAPFLFASEALQGVACSGGCIVQIPALPARVVYYRIRYMNGDGETVKLGPILAKTSY